VELEEGFSMSVRIALRAAIITAAILFMGCQPPPNRNSNSRIGRLARGNVGTSATGGPAPFNNPNAAQAGTQWGEITSSSDQTFQQELYFFTMPMLASAGPEDQLGYVSSQHGQQTGVAFWGEASVFGSGTPGYASQMSSGQLDGSHARIHIEIYDDKTGQQRSDGSVRPQIVVHIGYDQSGFVSAQGTVQNGQVNMVFTDSMGSVIMQGMLQGQYFTGTMAYTNSQTGGQQRTLGQFTVPACGFFVCGP
jgi:hypothetical protein